MAEVANGDASPQVQGGDSSQYRLNHLLITHGEVAMRQGLAGILRRAGYDVDEAADFDEGLAGLDKGDIDTLVVSLRLPPNGCLTLLDACKSPPPTVVLNGHMEDAAEVAADRRVRLVLTRPFPLQALFDAVNDAAQRSRDR